MTKKILASTSKQEYYLDCSMQNTVQLSYIASTLYMWGSIPVLEGLNSVEFWSNSRRNKTFFFYIVLLIFSSIL